jgi:hypothetical protein
MNKLHQLDCGTKTKNVGFKGCTLDWKTIAGAFYSDSDRELSPAEVADLQNTLQQAAWADNKLERIYPIHNFLNPTDNTEEPVFQTFADGSKAKVRDGVYDWTFQFTRGGFCLLQALRSHANNGGYALFYDKEGKILGKKGRTGGLGFIPLQVFDAAPWRVNTGAATAVYAVHFIFDTEDVNKNAEFVQVDFDLKQVEGLQDVKIVVNHFNKATGVINFNLITECGGSDLYDTYSDDFTASLFNAANAETGGTIAVSNLQKVPVSKSFNMTLAPGSLPASGFVSVGASMPSDLADANIEGFEVEDIEIALVES